MKLESIRLKNFKAFKDVEMRDIPKLCVLVGASGTGKSSLFSVFGFLKNALSGNINTALAALLTLPFTTRLQLLHDSG